MLRQIDGWKMGGNITKLYILLNRIFVEPWSELLDFQSYMYESGRFAIHYNTSNLRAEELLLPVSVALIVRWVISR